VTVQIRRGWFPWPAVISAGAAVTAVVLTRRAAVRDRQAEAAELALRYQEPLVHAAFNLQTRLYNIASPTHVFLQRFLANGTPPLPAG
jgi:hypothetical protein